MFLRFIIVLCFILSGCVGKEEKSAHRYMDISGFFRQEAAWLKAHDARINKTVSRNGNQETRNNVSPDWETELSLFIESDINKPAWNRSYKITSDSTGLIYSAMDDKLRTRLITVRKDSSGKVSYVSILNSVENNLYTSSEELLYRPNFGYNILKRQQVILLGDNEYSIGGVFIKAIQ
jgi:hypothetical protein